MHARFATIHLACVAAALATVVAAYALLPEPAEDIECKNSFFWMRVIGLPGDAPIPESPYACRERTKEK